MSHAHTLTDDDVRRLLRTHAAYERMIRCVACDEEGGRLDRDGICEDCRKDMAKHYEETEGPR